MHAAAAAGEIRSQMLRQQCVSWASGAAVFGVPHVILQKLETDGRPFFPALLYTVQFENLKNPTLPDLSNHASIALQASPRRWHKTRQPRMDKDSSTQSPLQTAEF